MQCNSTFWKFVYPAFQYEGNTTLFHFLFFKLFSKIFFCTITDHFLSDAGRDMAHLLCLFGWSEMSSTSTPVYICTVHSRGRQKHDSQNWAVPGQACDWSPPTLELVDTPARAPTAKAAAAALSRVCPGVPLKENSASARRAMCGRACVNI